jgi:N-acetylneuraminic acid mutarotase
MARARIPIAAPLETREIARSSNFFTDSILVNCYVETQQDGRKFVVKRPCLVANNTYNGGGATNGQGTAYYKGGLYAMGSNVLYRLTGGGFGSADGSAWTASTSGPFQGRAYAGCVVFNGQVLIMGGENTGGLQWMNDVWASTDCVNWTQVVSAAPWTKRARFGLVVLGNTLYLIGGQGNGKYFNDVWSTTDGVNWSQVISSATWKARRNMGVAAYNQGIFMMGGQDSSGTYYNDVWFSPDGATWTQQALNATWSARMDFVCLAYNAKLWVMGGYNGAALASCFSTTDGIT